ncbi:MarR family winged helix-turn-helix transcriptional regulator [Humidisolicoccus flavus]|uniref:MarR family winged helix-turn-helix transcriptional regulator n=1 Tax=Humidisolicoccus flavus TaxID=3111414 RepID=UPI0032518712
MDSQALQPRLHRGALNPATGAEIPAHAALEALVQLVTAWSTVEVQSSLATAAHVTVDPADVRLVHTLGQVGGEARPSELSAMLRVSRPTMSKMIARLAARELVSRSSTVLDGRSRTIALTTSGHAAYRRLVGIGHDLVSAALEPWPDHDAAEFARMLTRFVDNLLAATAAHENPMERKPQ